MFTQSILFLFATIICKNANAQELACSSSNSQNVYSFTVAAASPLGEVNMMYVQHDGKRLIPLATTALYNSLNHEMNVPRTDSFREYPCTSLSSKQTVCKNTYKMTPAQASHSGKTAFDRGHLTPSNPFRFSEEANKNTFYCVNIAPQDPYTNQGPWYTVEEKAHSYLATKPGYVMTGLCDLDDRYSPTLDGYKVPACFWKLICYLDNSGTTRVVGFIGNNTLVGGSNSAEKAKRLTDTTTPLGQQDVLNVMSRDSFIMDAWGGAQTYLLRNRNEKNAPTAANCKAERTITTAVKNEWSNLMRDAVIQQLEELDLN